MKSSPIKVKISFNEEIHTISFNLSFDELQEKIKTIYKNKLPPKFKIFYIDIEGDIISISCQEDLEEAQEIFGKENFPFKLMIDVSTESVRESIKIESKSKEKDRASNIKKEDNQNLDLGATIKLTNEHDEAKKSINSLYVMEEEKKVKQQNISSIQQKENPEHINNVQNSIVCQKCRGSGKDNQNQPCILCQGIGKQNVLYPSLESYYSQNASYIKPENIFICKLCSNEIKGIRYKCVICKSLDICEKCGNTFGHPHALLKIKDPSMDPKIILVVPNEMSDDPLTDPTHPDQGIINYPIFSEKEKYEIQVIKEAPVNSLHILPGQMFSKTFTIKNTGKIAWPVSTKMEVLGGDNLSGKEIHIGSLHPGKEIDITQMLKSPLILGKFSQTFQIIYTDQYKRKFEFGQLLIVEIEVENNLERKPGNNISQKVSNDIEIPKEFQENAKRLMELGITDKEFIISALTQVKNDFDKVAELIFSKANPK